LIYHFSFPGVRKNTICYGLEISLNVHVIKATCPQPGKGKALCKACGGRDAGLVNKNGGIGRGEFKEGLSPTFIVIFKNILQSKGTQNNGSVSLKITPPVL